MHLGVVQRIGLGILLVSWTPVGVTPAPAQTVPDLSADLQWMGRPRPTREAPRSEVGLVFVEVVVNDRDGQPVTGLTEGAFSVQEDGMRRRVSSFRAVDVAAPTVVEPSRVSSNTGDTEAPPRRTFVVVYDDLHLGDESSPLARDAAARFVTQHTGPGDQVIVVVPGLGLVWSPDKRGDADPLGDLKGSGDQRSDALTDYEAFRVVEGRDERMEKAVLERLRGTGLDTQEAVRAEAEKVLAEARERRRGTLGSLAAVLQVLTAERTRKAVLLVSEGFIHDPRDRLSYQVLTASQQANAAVYVLDARRLTEEGRGRSFRKGESTGAEILATLTGGEVLTSEESLARIAQDTSHHYVLGYLPAEGRPGGPGRLRRIRVDVSHPGAIVLGRRAYWDGEAESGLSSRGGVSVALQEALRSPARMRQVPLRLTALALAPAPDGRMEIAVAAEASAEGVRLKETPDGSQHATLDVVMAVRHVRPGAGTTSSPEEIEVRVPEGAGAKGTWLPLRRRVTLPPGLAQVKLVVRDRASGAMGTVVHPFEVPDPSVLQVSAPILSDLPDGDGVTAPQVVARRSFPPGSVLYCYFEVFPDAGAPAGIATQTLSGWKIVDARGKVRKRSALPLPVRQDGGGLARLVEIPLARIEPGRYELVVDLAADGGEEATTLREPFSVARPATFSDDLYRNALSAYLEGDARSAVNTLIQWPSKDVLAAAERLPRNGERLVETALLLHTDLALLLRRHGLEEGAESHITIGRTLAEDPALDELRREWLLAMAYAHQTRARPSEALRFYMECADAYPEAGRARMGAGTLYERIAFFPTGFGRGNLMVPPRVAARAAEGSYREALKVQPSLTEARLRLARVLQKTERLDEALAELALVVESDDDRALRALGHLFWGEIAESRDDFTGAIDQYRSALEAEPNLQVAALALAQALNRRRGRRAAVDALVPALGQPSAPSPWLAYRTGPLSLSVSPLDDLRAQLQTAAGGAP